MSYEYYEIKKDKRDYKGKRYFRFDPHGDRVLQVCVNNGKTKKGRTNNFGIYYISRTTFLTNYYGMKYVNQIKFKKFKRKYKLVELLLRNTV